MKLSCRICNTAVSRAEMNHGQRRPITSAGLKRHGWDIGCFRIIRH